MSSPETVPMGGRGQPYFGSGWLRPEGYLRRVLPPGRARLYLPLEREIFLDFTIDSRVDGELLVNGEAPVVVEGASLRFALAPRDARGLQAVDVEWRGAAPVTVSAIETAVVP
jgi:hypothetical protein